jgi:hypothetical protein
MFEIQKQLKTSIRFLKRPTQTPFVHPLHGTVCYIFPLSFHTASVAKEQAWEQTRTELILIKIFKELSKTVAFAGRQGT